jgi:hypothetical protein
MIIDDLDVFSACVRPTETHAELIVYPNAMLSRQEFFGIFEKRRFADVPA